MSINIVLVEPEIPQNTGNIIRTCAITGANLHMVRPFGFHMSDKYLKRSGLDYHDIANIKYYDDLEDFFSKNKEAKFYYATTKAGNNYANSDLTGDVYILFGKETAGLPEKLLFKNPERCIRIPMRDIDRARSLNLGNSVAIILYEALRQNAFDGLR